MPLSIILDSRERKLVSSCKELVIPYKISTLSLGDIHIVNEKNEVCMMIERKTWQDLASSIIDNRYREQHARYMEWAKEHNCEVWYVLEGNRKFRTPAQEKRTISAFLSLCFDKWIRVVESKTPTTTMEWIHKVLQKISTKGYSWLSCGIRQENQCVGGDNQNILCDKDVELAQQKVSKLGKKTHSKLSTWIAMLSCIYGMSVYKAETIMKQWSSPDEFIKWLRTSDEKDAVKRLQTIKIIIPKSKKERNLGAVLAKRIVSMFYYIKDS